LAHAVTAVNRSVRPYVWTNVEGWVSDQGDALLRALYDQHAAVLWSFVVPLTGGDRMQAQDVVQETMLRAWKHPEVLAQSQRSARSWLFTVAHRIVIDEWRRARTGREVLSETVPEVIQPDRTEAMLNVWLIADALDTLSPDHRAVIVECYYRGRSTSQAAEALGIPDGTVKSRTHYALRALRLSLQEMGVTQ
jgi:RNA polymerase sigma-70 factor (ECF subfamily)